MNLVRRKNLVSAALVWAAFATASHAQAPAGELTPDQRAAARMDRYFTDPTGVGTYRALSGLGDPNADRFYDDDSVDPDLIPFYVELAPQSTAVDWRHGRSHWSYRANSTCRLDYGAETLRARVRGLGAEHPYIQQWLAVQRTVYWPCMHPTRSAWRRVDPEVDGPAPRALPPAMATNDPALVQLQLQDRAYQEAAFAFYRGDQAAALAGFERAGADPTSPHRPIARYMTAAIHAGSRGDDDNWRPTQIVSETQLIDEIEVILRDRSLASVHFLTQRLLGWVRASADTEGYARVYTREMLAALHTPIETLRADPEAKRRYDAALADLEYIAPSFDDPAWFLNAGPPDGYHVSRALMNAARRDHLAAWALAPASPLRDGDGNAAWALYTPGASYALSDEQSWNTLLTFSVRLQREGDAAWGIAARGFARNAGTGGCDFVEALSARARANDEQAAAQLGFDFYDWLRANLAESGRDGFDQAVTCMTAFPFQQSRVWRGLAQDGLRYLMSCGRIDEARRWRDAVASGLDRAPRELLILLAEDEDHLAALMRDENDLAYYGEATRFLNRLSNAALWRLAERSDVAHRWRALLARVAWTRLYALDRPIGADQDALMRDLNPELTANWTSLRGEGNDDFRLLLDVMASPGLNILITPHNRSPEVRYYEGPGLSAIDTFQHSDNNWWCRFELQRHEASAEQALMANFMGSPTAFAASHETLALRNQLSTLERASFVLSQQDRHEQEALAQIDCAPKMFSERALAWAAQRGAADSRDQVAEALALAVRSTRWGCQRDGGHGRYSRRAFDVLQRDFSGTIAARRTRNWFDCEHFSGGCPVREAR
jgi:hypothetical protein